MGIGTAIEKIETSNRGIDMLLETINEQLDEISQDPRMENLTGDLKDLFESYLLTWRKNNSEILTLIKSGDSIA
ncbi:hypothetical protein [Nitrosopumilus sp.]|uniref:hypothetical protein n=1 Tax=Nitrosopumilus sp. TaxID=2024843 RepID=UPI0026063912|nr:hypothetical protein [Nitrosopumilus sp.]